MFGQIVPQMFGRLSLARLEGLRDLRLVNDILLPEMIATDPQTSQSSDV